MQRVNSKLENTEKKLPVFQEKQHQEFLQRVDIYNTNPRRCERCNKAIEYFRRRCRYCSSSCAASVNNKGIKRNIKNLQYVKKKCCYCDKETNNNKFCSSACCGKYTRQQRREKIKNQEQLIDCHYDKWYLEEIRGKKCEICGIVEWTNKPVPLVLDHKDGNSDNNNLYNVRLICHNCNALTNTFCGRNKGNGRWTKRGQYRNKRFHQGLSY